MRNALLTSLVFAACSAPPKPAPAPPVDPHPSIDTPDVAVPVAPLPVEKTKLSQDTPQTTPGGTMFVAPAGWTVWTERGATFVEVPEGGSRVMIADLSAPDAEAALAQAWTIYKPAKTWPLQITTAAPDHDGWSKIKQFGYETSPNERRSVGAAAMFANDTWTVLITDVDDAIGEKRGGQFGVIFGKLLPKGGARESFAGKTPHPLDKERIATLVKFVEDSRKVLDVPGVSFGLIENGKVVYAGGSGVRQLGKPATVDADTKYLIASNTKALTTLLLARLVDRKALGWDTTATSLLPSFKLGDADTTSKVTVKHLICACTGMPRQDLEWILEFKDLTASKVLAALGGMQPTSKFGELFQYSNIMAAAAGFIGGHVANPKLELGAAYDAAMRKDVFEPLGMTSTTLDFARGQTGNYAMPHGEDLDNHPAQAAAGINLSIVPVRPAGGAWSSVRDLLKYVAMELAEGKLPDGKVYVSKDALFARRAPQVKIGNDTTYGMGLMVNTRYGIPIVHHGGDMIGFHSDMMWLPEHGIGIVVMSNDDNGGAIRHEIQRKLLEILFDGRPEADANIASAKEQGDLGLAAFRKQIVVPADDAEAGKLAARYANPALGDIVVIRKGKTTVFDFGEWKSEVASKKNQDGTVSFVTIVPGLLGLELVVGTGDKKTLLLRDAQHEYVFTEK